MYPEDIQQQIKALFGQKTPAALRMLKVSVSKYEYIGADRIIRCILYLSEGSLDGLKNAIQMAVMDPRDVMFTAEYIGRRENEEPERVRDFNQPFGQESNVTEE
ncbi:MAG: hypothetical protein F6K11_00955 [Leptolyngbya sp. SIO3F4]|nr:hypothetical protein [Leptolyngbya sp. SIO3F4]